MKLNIHNIFFLLLDPQRDLRVRNSFLLEYISQLSFCATHKESFSTRKSSWSSKNLNDFEHKYLHYRFEEHTPCEYLCCIGRIFVTRVLDDLVVRLLYSWRAWVTDRERNTRNKWSIISVSFPLLLPPFSFLPRCLSQDNSWYANALRLFLKLEDRETLTSSRFLFLYFIIFIPLEYYYLFLFIYWPNKIINKSFNFAKYSNGGKVLIKNRN